MQNWEYHFPPSSKEDWIRQIEKDLKGKPMESLYGEWWPGETLIPIHHADDAHQEPIILPDELFAAPPQITEYIVLDQRPVEEINTYLLDALEFGTQTFLITKSNYNEMDQAKLLEGIHLDMVNLHFYANALTLPLFRSVYRQSPQTCFLRIQRSKDSGDLTSALHDLAIDPTKFGNLKFEYHFSSTDNWIEEATKVFRVLLEDAQQWPIFGSETSFFDHCILKLEADSLYFKHIIQTRVLHLLWLNLTGSHSTDSIEKRAYLECHILPNAGETPEHYLIRLSMSSLAAFMTGTTALCIHHLQKEGLASLYKRIDRNLHHLLHLESGLPVGKDPLAGAYTFDFYTRKWTERIWKQLFEG